MSKKEEAVVDLGAKKILYRRDQNFCIPIITYTKVRQRNCSPDPYCDGYFNITRTPEKFEKNFEKKPFNYLINSLGQNYL